MPEKKKNRRDFLKLGGLAALSTPAAKVISRKTGYEIVESKEEFGEFWIKRHTKDDPPYEVDYSKYKRSSSLNTSFTRNPDKTLIRNMVIDENLKKGEPGDDWLAYAFNAGTGAYMFAKKEYAWEGTATLPVNLPGGQWIAEEHGYSIEDVTKIVKRAAKFYGASLVGIAPVNPMWFYSEDTNADPTAMIQGMADGPPPGMPPGGPMGAMDPEKMAELMPKVLAKMDAKELKAMMVSAMENMDPDILPMPLAAFKALPADSIKAKIPEMMANPDPALQAALQENMDPSMIPISLIMEELDLKEMMKDFDPTVMMGDPIPIIFTDDVGTPVNSDEGKFIPNSMKWIIVMAFEMDEGGINTGGTSHVVSQLGEGAAMDGYSRMATTSYKVANMLRRLGWNAIPMGNDHGLSVPMAIDAGLGEQGRIGTLITPKYGPRVRLAKVLTDLPLIEDQPISFGVTEFCEVCAKCADFCPSGAISSGERTYDSPDSGIPGLLHWPAEGDKCFGTWADVGGSCYQCIRVCPFQKPEGWLHDATRILIGAKSGSLDKVLLKLDDISGYGQIDGNPVDDFWDTDTYVHIKD